MEITSTCTICNIAKSKEDFHKKSANKSGITAACKVCRNKDKKEYRKANRDKCNSYNSNWQKLNPDKSRKACSKYKRNNPGKINCINMTRHALKLQRTPKWLSREQKAAIREFYIIAKELQWLSEEPLEVDHIVPLQGKNVSGLHVPWNLQILPQSVNSRKRNKF